VNITTFKRVPYEKLDAEIIANGIVKGFEKTANNIEKSEIE